MILPSEIRELIEALRREIAELRSENEALRADNGALRAEVTELRRRLDLDSSTSSKPPSSDGLKKKPRVPGSLRGRSGKPSGGQAGHKGDTLKQVEAPDRIERHTTRVCRRCCAGLTASMQTGMEKRQVFDLAERLIEITEHLLLSQVVLIVFDDRLHCRDLPGSIARIHLADLHPPRIHLAPQP